MQHIYPIDDLEPHDLASAFCKCRPRVERCSSHVGGQAIVIHNSFDGREILENALSSLELHGTLN